MPTLTQDPRSIVTPEAFSVHPPLLGTPLAEPWRRAVAILIDLLLVVLVTAVTSGFGFILGVVVAAFFFSRATKPGNEGRRSPAFRFFLGCMGVTALSLTIVVFLALRFVNGSGDRLGPDGPSVTVGIDGREVDALGELGLRGAIGGLTETVRLASTDSPEEAVLLAALLGRRVMEAGMSQDEVEEFLAEIIPDDAGGVDGDVLLDRAMAALSATPAAGAPGDGAEDGPAAAELARAMEVAADTIAELERELERAEDDVADLRSQRAEDEEGGGLTRWFSDRIDSVGFGLGWWTMYFAILMPWMHGQTPGKRALGIRVVRLDGNPVTWWHAFERAGGYAAGLATGTLGFAQIYWDPNRQGIHDKVAGTVVIVDGAEKIPGPWTLTESTVAASAETGSAAADDAATEKEG